MYICKVCEKEFLKFQDKANHVRWAHIEKTEEKKKNHSEGTRKANEKRFGRYKNEKVICSKEGCSKSVDIIYREGKKKNKYYCSISCSNSRGKMSDELKTKISEKISQKWKEGAFDHITEYHSKNKIFSSKTERLIVKYFKINFPEDEWKSGGIIKYQYSRISRDMYSDKLKVCFEYDGIWHFKDINGQLEYKKDKDRKLENWCIENKYRLIRIQDGFYIDENQVYDLLYKRTESILKIGNLYHQST